MIHLKRLYSFLKYCGKNKGLILIYMISQAAIILLEFAYPEILRLSTDAITSKTEAMLYQAIILAVVSTTLYVILTSISKPLETHIYNKCEQALQQNMLDKILSLKKIRLSRYSSGDIITKATMNTQEAIRRALAFFFAIFQGVCGAVFGGIYLLWLDWRIFLVACVFNLGVKKLFNIANAKIKSGTKKLVNVTKTNNSFLLDILNNLFTVRALSKQKFFENILAEREKETLKSNMIVSAFYKYSSYILMIFMNKFAEFAVAYAVGGYLVIKGVITFGTMAACIVALDIFVKGVGQIFWGYAEEAAALPNVENITTFLEDPECDNEPETEICGGTIRFDDVCFSYGDNEVLKNVSFEIRPGEKVLLRGRNGEGKSTLLKLITGLYRPISGRILYSGTDTASVNLSCMSAAYCYITQQSNILIGNIYENIALSSGFDKPRCEDILTKLNMPGVKENEPSTLSQGEKQRLNISRAFYRSADILIGDEIFSNVDAGNRNHIANMVSENFKSRTIIFVCHDDVPFQFDRVLTVEGGCVHE